MHADQRPGVSGFERRGRALDGAGGAPAHRVDGHPADHADEQADHGADAETYGTDEQVPGAHGGDARGPVLGVAHRSHRQDVELEQLEQNAQAEPGLHVPEDESRDRRGDERPRDHHLGDAHQIEPHQRAPQQQRQLDVEAHTNSCSGTARAVGTSWAVISMPLAASWRSLFASASVRYT